MFFGERGANFFKGFQVWDLAATYNVPVFQTLRPYVNLSLFNAFNNQKLIRWNTTVTPDPTSPVDENGLRTGFARGPIHRPGDQQQPVPGAVDWRNRRPDVAVRGRLPVLARAG